MKRTILITLLVMMSAAAVWAQNFAGAAFANDVFRISVGMGNAADSNVDVRILQQRVMELERAVQQLQARVFQISYGNSGNQGGTTVVINAPAAAPAAPAKTVTCIMRAMGQSYMGTGTTKMEAVGKASKECAQAGNSFFCKPEDAKCDN